MEYAVFKQQIMEQAKRILPQEEGYVITIVDQTEYGLGEMLISKYCIYDDPRDRWYARN